MFWKVERRYHILTKGKKGATEMYNTRSRNIAIVSYITWIGWIIAFVLRDRNDAFAAHHLNQALMINLLKIAGGLCAFVPHIGENISGFVGIAALVCIIVGIYRAVNWRTDPLPVIGEFKLI